MMMMPFNCDDDDAFEALRWPRGAGLVCIPRGVLRYFLFLQEQIKGIIITCASPEARAVRPVPPK